ncbi:hypothetical protein [Formosa algae]|uniref:Nucleotidyltransferase n=1 Tax=Formosa algae TaxID=225843 RepID=A0A9X0YHG3_9FLAO|nr:hypothetical protein [Formosa algae]MBP1838627.1 putative nucleotidyltransferase [Formosa algae]MDQ0335127.1 putative nucleotidyltransferase [Formosa algae]OEI80379.1 hypothetical protein AST99_09230 [Formosa algae]
MDIDEFVDNLKRDKARGELAPHQIILLLSLHKLYLENKSNVIETDDLMDAFNVTWKEHQNSFKTKNNNIGMPLKAFVNRGYLEIDINEEINDFRSKTELITKVIQIKINQVLLELFKDIELSNYLKMRINT